MLWCLDLDTDTFLDIQQYLERLAGMVVIDIDGKTPSSQRQIMIDRFNSRGPHLTAKGQESWGLIMTKCLSEGVNLHRGTVLMLLVSNLRFFWWSTCIRLLNSSVVIMTGQPLVGRHRGTDNWQSCTQSAGQNGGCVQVCV